MDTSVSVLVLVSCILGVFVIVNSVRISRLRSDMPSSTIGSSSASSAADARNESAVMRTPSGSLVPKRTFWVRVAKVEEEQGEDKTGKPVYTVHIAVQQGDDSLELVLSLAMKRSNFLYRPERRKMFRVLCDNEGNNCMSGDGQQAFEHVESVNAPTTMKIRVQSVSDASSPLVDPEELGKGDGLYVTLVSVPLYTAA